MVLYLLIIVNALFFLSVAAKGTVELPPGVDPAFVGAIPYVGAAAVMAFLGLWGVWRWRRWGVTLVISATVMSVLLDMFLIHQIRASELFAPVMLFMIWLLRNRWSAFE